MRALFWKDSLLLSAILAFGLMVFSAMAFELGFDRAFVLPFSPMPEELIWGWVLWAAGFGWMLGATDRLRGVVGYVEHRGFSKARLFSTQLANGGLVLLAVLILPWCFLAILDRGLFEPDFMGLGSRWLWASTIALPCFGVGMFTAKLPLHWGIRLVVAAAALPWVVGERPELAILTPMHFGPLGFAARNLVACAVLLLAAYLADKAQGDRDIPLGRAAIFPVTVVLVAVGWSWYSIATKQMADITEKTDRNYVAIRPDGSFVLATKAYDPEEFAAQHWEVDPVSHKPTVRNENIQRLPDADELVRPTFSKLFTNVNSIATGLPTGIRKIRTFSPPHKGRILHLVQIDGYQGRKVYLDRSGEPFSNQAALLRDHEQYQEPIQWIGDPVEGRVWSVDFRKQPWRYEPVALPEGAHFVEWLESFFGTGRRILDAVIRETPGAEESTLALLRTSQGYGYLNLRTGVAKPINMEALSWIEQEDSERPPFLLETTEPGILFHTQQVETPSGEVLFHYEFQPSTFREVRDACATAFLSFSIPPLLEPSAFSNITRVAHSRDFDEGKQPSPSWSPLGFTALGAHNIQLLRWTGWSKWSLIGWGLLLLCVSSVRRQLKRRGVGGPRLWLWPLAILAFGAIGLVAYYAFEPKRAHYAIQRMASKDPRPLWKSA